MNTNTNPILRAFAEGRIQHLNRGQCPDMVSVHDSRDPDCPVCAALSTAAEQPCDSITDLRTKQSAPATQQALVFDEQGFRDWVLRNLPDDTIIGSSAWWADHLTTWVQRFMTAAPQQEAQEPVAWQGVHDQTDLYYTKPAQADVRPLYTTTQPAPAAQGDTLDAAFEAVRHRLCGMQRYSFALDDDGVVRRVEDRTGRWIEFDDAHELFDPVAVDAARSQAKKGGA